MANGWKEIWKKLRHTNNKEQTQKELLQEELGQRLEQLRQNVKAYKNYTEYYRTLKSVTTHSERVTKAMQEQIPLQNPKADLSMMATADSWEKALHRTIRPGEKGAEVTGCYMDLKSEERVLKDISGRDVLEADGRPKMGTLAWMQPSDRKRVFYDISQTEGEPAPKPPDIDYETDSSVKGFSNLMKAIDGISPYPIKFVEQTYLPGAIGETSNIPFRPSIILIQNGLSQRRTLRTAFHEMAHATLHKSSWWHHRDVNAQETEAESVSFLACAHYGADIAYESIPYLLHFEGGEELPELQNAKKAIVSCASKFILGIDKQLAEFQKESTQSVSGNSDKSKEQSSNLKAEASEPSKRIPMKEQMSAGKILAEQNNKAHAAELQQKKTEPEKKNSGHEGCER